MKYFPLIFIQILYTVNINLTFNYLSFVIIHFSNESAIIKSKIFGASEINYSHISSSRIQDLYLHDKNN